MKRELLNGVTIKSIRKTENWKHHTLYNIYSNGWLAMNCMNITEVCQWLEWRFYLPEIKAITPMKRFNRIIKLIEG